LTICELMIISKQQSQTTDVLTSDHDNGYHDNGYTGLVPLHALTRHTVDDAITVGIHEPDCIRHEPQTEAKSKTRPEENVEYRRIILRILCSQVQRILHKQQSFRLITTTTDSITALQQIQLAGGKNQAL